MWDLVFVGKKENFAFSLQSLKLFCKGQFFDQAIICSQSKSYNPSLVMGFNIPTTGIAAVDKMAMLSITWYEYQLASARPEIGKKEISEHPKIKPVVSSTQSR